MTRVEVLYDHDPDLAPWGEDPPLETPMSMYQRQRTWWQRVDYRAERFALASAIARCHNKNHPSWHAYGGRGLRVCPEWRHGRAGFARFLAHIGPKPSPELTLERINNDLGYQPNNVKWATRAEQTANRRPRQEWTPRAARRPA